MKDTIEIYVNYGVLAAEKRKVYTYGMPSDTATVSDKITVKIPDGWKLDESSDGSEILTSPWGWEYRPNEVLAGNDNPIFRAYDKDGREYVRSLTVIPE